VVRSQRKIVNISDEINRAWPFVYAAVLLGMIGWINFISVDDRQFRRLAESFLDGKLFFFQGR
jgi:hypothetical protein